MSATTKLQFAADTKPVGASITIDRRKRVAKSINAQVEQIRAEIDGDEYNGRKKAAWHWMNEDGVYFCSIKYGKKPLELQKGKYAVVCHSLTDITEALEVLREMVLKGEYDTKLESMAKTIRSTLDHCDR